MFLFFFSHLILILILMSCLCFIGYVRETSRGVHNWNLHCFRCHCLVRSVFSFSSLLCITTKPSLTLSYFSTQVIPCAIYMNPKLNKGFNPLKMLYLSTYISLLFIILLPSSIYIYIYILCCFRQMKDKSNLRHSEIKDIVAASGGASCIHACVATAGTSLIIGFVSSFPHCIYLYACYISY